MTPVSDNFKLIYCLLDNLSRLGGRSHFTKLFLPPKIEDETMNLTVIRLVFFYFEDDCVKIL